MRTRALIPLAAWLVSTAFAQAPEGYRISTNVDHVMLPVTVVDRKGEFVSGLTQDAFQVFEDGKPQPIAFFSQRDIPLTIGLVVDSSGSMAAKRAEAVTAALQLVRLSNPEDELFTVTFNEKVSFGPSGEPFTNDAGKLRDALVAQRCTGRTALYDALEAALERLSQGSRDKKALVLMSDGGDNASRRSFSDVLDMAAKSNVIIYTIGLFARGDDDRNPGVLRKLAKQTGGEVYLPQETSELTPICAHVARELRTQYTLAYSPGPDVRAAGYHRIQVVVSRPGGGGKLTARTRAGYVAPAPEAQQAEGPRP